MAVAFVNSIPGAFGLWANNTGPRSVAFDVGTGANRLLMAFYHAPAWYASIQTMTYAGVAMTRLYFPSGREAEVHDRGYNPAQIEVWYLINPPTGSNIFTVTHEAPSHNSEHRVGLMAFSGVSQNPSNWYLAGSVATFAQVNNPNSYNLSPTSTADGMVVASATFGFGGGNITTGTRRYGNYIFAGAGCVGHTFPGTGAPVTVSVSTGASSTSWAACLIVPQDVTVTNTIAAKRAGAAIFGVDDSNITITGLVAQKKSAAVAPTVLEEEAIKATFRVIKLSGQSLDDLFVVFDQFTDVNGTEIDDHIPDIGGLYTLTGAPGLMLVKNNELETIRWNTTVSAVIGPFTNNVGRAVSFSARWVGGDVPVAKLFVGLFNDPNPFAGNGVAHAFKFASSPLVVNAMNRNINIWPHFATLVQGTTYDFSLVIGATTTKYYMNGNLVETFATTLVGDSVYAGFGREAENAATPGISVYIDNFAVSKLVGD